MKSETVSFNSILVNFFFFFHNSSLTSSEVSRSNFQLMYETQTPKHFLRTGIQGAFEAEVFVKSSFIHHKICF